MGKMRFLYAIVCFCVLVFDWHDARVDALLNITDEAVATGRRLMKEISGNSFIFTEDDLHNKLKRLEDIAQEFQRKYAFEMNIEYKYKLDWLSFCVEKKFKSLVSFSFKNNLVKFGELKNKINLRNGVIDVSERIGVKEIFDIEFPEFGKGKFGGVVSHERFNQKYYRDVQRVFNELYQLFFYYDKESQISIFHFLKNTTQYLPESSLDVGCKAMSPQLRLFSTIKDLAVSEAFFFLKHQYQLALLQVYSEATSFLNAEDRKTLDTIKFYWEGKFDVVSTMKIYEEKFQLRSFEVIDLIKPALSSLPRNSQTPVPKNQQLYTELKVFQKYFVNEVDLNADGSCKNTCSDYKQVEKVFGCFDGGICSVHKKCKGKLWDCEDIVDPIHICSWHNESQYGERYKFIKGNDYNPSEDDRGCPTEVKRAEYWRRGFYKCNYCQCKCEDAETDSDRYFSLRPATSNIYDNYVVVKVKFETINHVVHVVVTEGKLLPNGLVDLKSLRDVPVKNFSVIDEDVAAGKDFQPITGDARTVCLDELESPNDHLLTGLKLHFDNGHFKLEIRMTQFEYATGKLHPEKSVWYSKDTDLNDRSEINLNDFGKEPEESVKSDGCVRFTTSQMENKLGQHTVPYIDNGFIINTAFAPLSGAGIILKKGETNEFLGFKLITQDARINLFQ